MSWLLPPDVSVVDLAAERLARLGQARAEDEAASLSLSLRAFIKPAWRQLEPMNPLIWGWHIDAVCSHLEAAAAGEIRTLLINVPPRHLKSSLVGVMFPAWLWTRNHSLKLLTGSYAMPLATRDATRTRRLITSKWYSQQWPQVRMEADQYAKMRYDLVGGGARYCFSTAGIVTGEGGDLIIYDDPHKPQDMYSDAKIEAAVQFWTETLPTRVNNPLTATKIIIMQRLGERDLSGYMMARAMDDDDSDLVHLMLPAHFDPLRACKTRWFRDPRKEQGELLWPELMNARAMKQITRR